MVILNLKLTLLVLIFVGISAIATNFVSNLSQRYYAENFAAMGALSGKIEEVYSGNHVIKVCNQQSDTIEDISKLNQNQFEANRKVQFHELQFYPFFPQYEGVNIEEYALDIGHRFIQEMSAKSKELQIILSPNFYLKE